jgi:hypothetical protein
MMCSMKTMLKVGLGMLLIAGLAYLALPEFRTWILAASPTLLFLICPVSMLVGMKMMQGQSGQSCQTPASDEKANASAASDKADVKAG